MMKYHSSVSTVGGCEDCNNNKMCMCPSLPPIFIFSLPLIDESRPSVSISILVFLSASFFV